MPELNIVKITPDTPSVTFLGENIFGIYNDYVAKIEVVRKPTGAIDCVKVLDRKNRDYLGYISKEFVDIFAKFDGSLAKFRGRFSTLTYKITPLIKQ